MTTNGSKSFLGHLNKLVEKYNNTYHRSIIKAYWYRYLTKEIESSYKAPKFKVVDRVKITKYKNIFSKVCTKNRSREIFVVDFVLKINPWTNKIKDLNGET